MKRLLVLTMLLLVGCSKPPIKPEPMSKYGEIYQGNHLLRQIGSLTTTSTHTGGTYFIIAGGFESSTTSDTEVTFAWLGNDGVYRFQRLPLDRIRIQIDEHIGVPFVKFRWDTWGYIKYAVIGANPKDWPQYIKLPSVGGR